jgi:hypothetical protein
LQAVKRGNADVRETFAPYVIVPRSLLRLTSALSEADVPWGELGGIGVVTGVWGYQPETSALTLLRDLQTLLCYHLRQPLSDLPRSEQRNAFRSEPLLGDPHQLLERSFAGIAEELDQTRRFSQACPASKVVNQGAATRSPVVGWPRSETAVTALDRRAAKLLP